MPSQRSFAQNGNQLECQAVALVLKHVVQIAKLPKCKDTLPAAGLYAWGGEYKEDNAISHMLQANGSFEWCPFDSHTQFWSQGGH